MRGGDPDRIERALTASKPPKATAADVAQRVTLYDEEIAYLDGQLGALFDDLRGRGLLERTVVVLAADLGEMFLEHGDVEHCRRRFDTVIRTPLVLWIPGVGGRRIAPPVQNVDLVPTLLDHLAVDPTGLGLEGTSLRPMIEGRSAPAPEYAYSMQNEARSVTNGRYKLIFDLTNQRAQLFDLHLDPGERADAASRLPRERDRLRHALAAWPAAHEGPGSAHRNVQLAQVEQSLRVLGHLQ